MKITILTMFPKMLDSLFESPVIKRAITQGKVEIETVDIKDFADGSFRHIDDTPYGGSDGMIIRIEPLVRSLESVKKEGSHVIVTSPKGSVYNQKKARELAKLTDLVIVCGHYEGIDARFETYVDEQISLGDFIITGGEGAAAIITDSVVRLLDGTLKDGVTEDESFEKGLLEYPQYTHPFDFRGSKVPEILLSGNTAEIEKWKHARAIDETKKHRPDIAESYMRQQIILAEDSLRCAFSNNISLSGDTLFSTDSSLNGNLSCYRDFLLPDMHDHNMFTYEKAPCKNQVEKLIRYQKDNGFNFIKIEGSSPIEPETVRELNLEEWKELTMALYESRLSEKWEINPSVEIKTLKKDKNGKDIIDIEMKNYADVYGEDFTLRKMHRYLTFAQKSKKMDFLCAYINNRIAGYLFTWVDNDCVGIDGLIVSPEFRNRKVATTLLYNAIKLAPFAYLHAEECDSPRRLYEKLGFRAVETKYCYSRTL